MTYRIQRLTDVIDSDILKYICLGYAQEEGLPLGIVELTPEPGDGGAEISTLVEHPLQFCRRLRGLPEGADLCADDCDRQVAEALRSNSDAPGWRVCRLGIGVYQVPIVIGGRVVAVVTGGQGRMMAGKGRAWDSETVHGRLSEIGVDSDEMLEHAEEAPEVGAEERDEIPERVLRVSRLIERIGRQRFGTLRRRHEEEFLDRIAAEFGRPRKMGDTLSGRLVTVFEKLNAFTNAQYSGLLLAESGKDDMFSPPLPGHNDRNRVDEIQPLLSDEAGRFYYAAAEADRGVIEGVQAALGIAPIERVFAQPMAFLDSSRGILLLVRQRAEEGIVENEPLLNRDAEFLRELVERLQSCIDVFEADRRKDDFMAEMTHRLKAPMQSVLAKSGFLGLYCRKQYPEDERIPLICQEIAHEVGVLNDQTKNYTFITTMDKGEQEFRMAPCSIMALMAECINRFDEVARGREIEIVAKLDASPGSEILIDRPKMDIVFTNLLDNGVKYSHGRKRIEVKGAFDWKAKICRITVSSFGLGIAEHEHELIFQRYYRARAMKDSRRFIPGTGIGLTVVREIIRGHGGTITVSSHRGPGESGLESREGEGYKTTFTIDLPIR